MTAGCKEYIGSSQFIESSLVVIQLSIGEGMKFGQLILRRIVKIVATKMSDFKAKMHRNRFRMGLRAPPQTPLGSLQRSPRPPSWI